MLRRVIPINAALSEREFLIDLHKSFVDAVEEQVKYALGDPVTVKKVKDRECAKAYRNFQLQKLIEEQKRIAVCPFCNSKGNYIEAHEKTECCGHGDYRTFVNVKCNMCEATMPTYGSGFEGELKAFIKWNNPTFSERELEYEYEKLLQKNLVLKEQEG